MRLTRLSLLCLSVLSGCAVRSAPVAEVPPRNMLFKATGRTGATVYVLGSVHLLTEEAGKLPAPIDSAFARAKLVAFETDLDTLQMRGLELFAHAKLPTGTMLKDVLSPKTYTKLEALLPQYSVNLQQLTTYKPWMIMLVMTNATASRAKFRTQFGVDFQIHNRAKAQHKRIVGLEPVEFQLTLFDKLTPADQEAMLAEGLVSADSAVKSLLKIQDSWVQGDTAAINRGLNENIAKMPAVFALLVSSRNRSWIPAIEGMLNGQDDALVVVGAAHLVGPQGVLALLRQKGYKVQAF